MLEKAFQDVYTKFKLHFYQNVFQRFATREATLTTVESFCMEGIMAMGEPTIAEFSRMMQISTPNAAYKIGSLVKKGYVEKIQSTTDRREYHLRPTQSSLRDASSPERGSFFRTDRKVQKLHWEDNDLEWLPLRFRHIQRKNYFKFRDSGTPAGVPLSHFHRKRRGGKLPVNRCALSRENTKTGSPQAARLCSCPNNFTRSGSIYFHRFSGY